MKLVLALLCLTTCTGALDIKIHEGNIDFIEKASMSQDGHCLDLETPDHNGRVGVKERTCFDFRKQKAKYATGLNQTKICYILNNDEEGSVEKQREEAKVLVTRGIPYNTTATIEETIYLPSLTEISNVNEVHPKLREFCKGMPMFWMSKVSSLKEAESDAMAQLKVSGKNLHRQSRQKRDDTKGEVIIKTACTKDNDKVLDECFRKQKADSLYTRCKFVYKTCTYRVKCFYSYVRSSGGYCSKTQTRHVFTGHACCDYGC